MNVDLEQSLDRLARSVGDDVAAERLGGQVHHMVARIRRRRAARRTATGVVGVGAAAAVAVGGVQVFERLGGSPQPVGPATWDAEAWGCGPTPAIPADASDLRIDVDHNATATSGTSLGVDTYVNAAGHAGLTFDAAPTVVLARDDVVVTEPAIVVIRQNSHPPQDILELDLSSCAFDGAPLPDGEYELLVTQTVGTSEGDVELFSSSPVMILGGEPSSSPEPTEPTEPDEPTSSPDDPPATLTPEQADAAEQIEAWIASPVANPDGIMPRCGAEAVLDDGSTPLVLDDPLDGPAIQPDRDGYFQTTATMRTRGDQYVIGNAAGAGATLVLMREGVVVGYQWLDSEDEIDVDLQPGQTLEIPFRGNQLLCDTGEGGTGPALRLPPGTYQATAVVDVMLKEVGVVGGGAESVTRTVPVMSEVFDITLT